MDKIIGLTDIVDTETEFFPLLSSEDEEIMNAEDVPDELAILPLRNTVLFPGVVIPITVGRDKSIALIKEAYQGSKTIGVVAQKDPEIEDPSEDDLQKTGTIARLIKILQMPDGNTTAIIQGKKRFEITEIIQTEPYFKAKITSLVSKTEVPKNEEFDALISSVKDLSIQIIEKSPAIPSEAVFAINNIESPVFLVNFVSSNLNVENDIKQKLLEITDIEKRANMVLEIMTKELQMLELSTIFKPRLKLIWISNSVITCLINNLKQFRKSLEVVRMTMKSEN